MDKSSLSIGRLSIPLPPNTKPCIPLVKVEHLLELLYCALRDVYVTVVLGAGLAEMVAALLHPVKLPSLFFVKTHSAYLHRLGKLCCLLFNVIPTGDQTKYSSSLSYLQESQLRICTSKNVKYNTIQYCAIFPNNISFTKRYLNNINIYYQYFLNKKIF